MTPTAPGVYTKNLLSVVYKPVVSHKCQIDKVNDTIAVDIAGNIRQLRNCIRTMVVMCDHDQIDVRDIPPEIAQRRQLTAGVRSPDLAGISLNELEKKAIIDTLAKTGDNREKAAKTLGIGERTLYRKIKEYKI